MSENAWLLDWVESALQHYLKINERQLRPGRYKEFSSWPNFPEFEVGERRHDEYRVTVFRQDGTAAGQLVYRTDGRLKETLPAS